MNIGVVVGRFFFRMLRRSEFVLLPALDRLNEEDVRDVVAKIRYSLPGRDVYYRGREIEDSPVPEYLTEARAQPPVGEGDDGDEGRA